MKKPSTDQGFFFRNEEVDAGDRATKKPKSKRKKVELVTESVDVFRSCVEGRHNDCPYHVYVQHKSPPRYETCSCDCGHAGRSKSTAWML